LLILLACTPLLRAQCGADINKLYVAKVIFERQGHLTPDQLALIRARLVGRCFDPARSGDLGELVYEEYQNLGYFRATVIDPIVRMNDEAHPKAATLTFDVEEGPRYVIEQVIWAGVNSLPVDEIEEISAARPGSVYDRRHIRETVDGVKRFYVANGFPQISISPKAETEGDRLKLSFHLKEGPHIPSE
jgi:outer membrane translocation and assembly module TamA